MSNISLVLEAVLASSFIGKFVKLKHLNNKNFVGLCPFHNEKTPSFRVDDDKGLFYCFGCNKGGNILNFLQYYKNISLPDAIEEIAIEYNIKLQKFNKAEDSKTKEHKSLLERVMGVFTSQLKTEKGRDALFYLQTKRGLTAETIEKFKLGFCPKEGDFLLSYFPSEINELLELGLIFKRDGGGFYSTFNERIIFPIFNQKNEVIAFAGRIFTKTQEDNKLAKYINSKESSIFKKHTALYGIEKIKKVGLPIVLVEGYLDVITMHQFGFNETVAQMGTAFSKEQIEILFHKTDEIIFCYDADEAGKKAERRSVELCLPMLTPKKKLSFLELTTKDADEFLKKSGRQEMGVQISKRLPLFEKIFNNLTKSVNFKNPEESALCEVNLMEFCKLIVNPLVKKSYEAYFKRELFLKRTTKVNAKPKNVIDKMELCYRDGLMFALFLKFPDFFKSDYYFEHFVPFKEQKLEKMTKMEEFDIELSKKIEKEYPINNESTPEEIYQNIYRDFIFHSLEEEKREALKTNDFAKAKTINEELTRLKNRT
jgi:DNA primase